MLAALGAGYHGIRRHFGKTAPATMLTVMALSSVLPMCYVVRAVRNNAPLSLPGAHWLRLDPTLTSQFHSTVDVLRTNGGPFFTVFGVNSLYFWTEMAPPTSANATLWPWMLNEAEQSAVVQALERDERSVVLMASGGHYLKEGATNHVLGRWILDQTTPREEIGILKWELRKRVGK